MVRESPMVPTGNERRDVDTISIVSQACCGELMGIARRMNGTLALQRIAHFGPNLQLQRRKAVQEARTACIADRRQASRGVETAKAEQVQGIGGGRIRP